MFTAMNVLITGVGGYIGSALADILLAQGVHVTGLDRFFFGQGLLDDLAANPNFTVVKKDIRDVQESDFAGIDAVCDLAALSNDPTGEIDPELTHDINHRGRLHVAQTAQAAGVRRYVLASSCSVYGAGKQAKLNECSEPNPVSTYAKANLAAECSVLPLNSREFSVTVLRQATVFGLSRRMRFDLAINLMTLNAVEKAKIFVLGGGHQWRPIVHVRDTARAFTEVLRADPAAVAGEVFNVGAQNTQILSLAYVVRENIPFPIELQVVPDDPDKRDYNVSFGKIADRIGYRTEITPDQGVREIYEALKTGQVSADPTTYTVAWYKKIIEAQRLVDSVKLNGRLL
jgi:nucleoside-diphosphate-sugar epimerase